MSGPDPVRVTVDHGVARIVLSRPDQGNAIDLAMAEGLRSAAVECERDSAIRCVVLTGAGRLFCGGGDLRALAAADDRVRLVGSITFQLHSAIAILARMAKPLVTVINGPAAGAGVSLAALGDVALAARAAHFTLAYGNVGLTPDAGTTWLLPRLVGLRRTQEWLLTNRRLTADEAAASGLVTRAVEADRLWAEADPLIAALAAGSTDALGRARALLVSSFHSTLETSLADEARAMSAAIAAAGGRSGLEAFAAGRTQVLGISQPPRGTRKTRPAA